MFYTEADKLIYTSPINKKYDPLALHRRLIVSCGGVINMRLATWTSETASDIERAIAEEDLVAVTRQAFNFKPFDQEDGVTDGVALNCLVDFLGWIEKNG